MPKCDFNKVALVIYTITLVKKAQGSISALLEQGSKDPVSFV